MASEHIECIAAELFELLVFFPSLASHNICHFGKKDEWCAFTIESKFGFEVPQKVAEVNVEEVPSLFNHDVVCVTVANTKHERGNAVAV